MKLFVQTYGCQMNQLDSDRIVHLMKQMDYELTERAEEADLLILNTCSVRDKAEQKVYSALGRWRTFKETTKVGAVLLEDDRWLRRSTGGRDTAAPDPSSRFRFWHP